MSHDCTRAIIDLDAVSSNFDAVCRKAKVPVMAVIKADAYGHGAVPIARLLENRCAFFGVSSMSEALELRDAGIARPILILGYTPPQAFPDAVRLGIRPAIFRREDGEALSRAAVEAGVSAAFHFAVDTGMSRIGFQVTEADADICAEIAALPGLTAEGLFSHFATADSYDLSRARAQAERFDAFDAMLKRRGVRILIRHLNNSAGLMNFDHHYEMVRSGIVTYGLYPSDEVDTGLLPPDSRHASAQPGLLRESPAPRAGDQLRRHVCHHPPHCRGHRPHRLRRRLPPQSVRQVLRPDPRTARPHSGAGLHGSDDGGRDRYPRRSGW